MSLNQKSQIHLVASPQPDPEKKDSVDAFWAGLWAMSKGELSAYLRTPELFEHRVLDYHWLNESKRRADYQILQDVYETTLENITDQLNVIHNTSFGVKFWRIFLGPWLKVYICSIFDRWETINALAVVVGDSYRDHIIYKFNDNQTVAADYTSALELMGQDSWNETIFKAIIDWKHAGRPAPGSDALLVYLAAGRERPSRRLFKWLFVWLVGITRKMRWGIAVKGSYLPTIFFIKLMIRMRQPVLALNLYFENSTASLLARFQGHVSFAQKRHSFCSKPLENNKSPDFQSFVLSRIKFDIPIVYVEAFAQLMETVKKVPRYKASFTANAHYHCEHFKLLMAVNDHVSNSKIILSAHGGGFMPEFDGTFHHQQIIAHKMVVWFTGRHSNEVKLTPNIFVNKAKLRVQPDNQILIIGYDNYKYANRLQTAAISSHCVFDLQQKIKFIGLLSPHCREHLTYKGYGSDRGWNFNYHISQIFPWLRIKSSGKLDPLIAASRLVVCSTPQTTFLDAMKANKPTILLCNVESWQLDDSVKYIFNDMLEAGIIFKCPKLAAIWVNEHFETFDEWWQGDKRQSLRDQYLRLTACDNYSGSDWIDFFHSVIRTEK